MAFSVLPLAEEDLPEVTTLHLEAFAGYANTRLGRGYVRAFLKWFIQSETAVARVAKDVRGISLGYVVGALLGYNRAMNRALLLPALGGIVVRPWLLAGRRFRSILFGRIQDLLNRSPKRKEPSLPGPILSLVAIGVASGARGQGVGGHLLRAFEQDARRMGIASLRLSVYSDNQVARRAYERYGWQAFGEPEEAGQAMFYWKILEPSTSTQAALHERLG